MTIAPYPVFDPASRGHLVDAHVMLIDPDENYDEAYEFTLDADEEFWSEYEGLLNELEEGEIAPGSYFLLKEETLGRERPRWNMVGDLFLFYFLRRTDAAAAEGQTWERIIHIRDQFCSAESLEPMASFRIHEDEDRIYWYEPDAAPAAPENA